ncbi:hypothetical protein ONS95_005955 [Cadophora gregata]|uniref:uncharacterized protein n=1 Tax=Cadophora gregata TaxID=51156 RepID=UPI0026DB3290|nr:uncharacterized protein ONS95_005955 [Cadophora gregata]KAK0102332.1 hypothetical protein ONS95_005955 [Cadophora gregata]
MHFVIFLSVLATLLPAFHAAALPNPNPDPNLNIIIDLPSPSEVGPKYKSKVLPAYAATFTPPPPPPPPPMPECLGSWQCPKGMMCKDNKCIAKKDSHFQIPSENRKLEMVLSEGDGGPKLPCEKHSDCGADGYCFRKECIL